MAWHSSFPPQESVFLSVIRLAFQKYTSFWSLNLKLKKHNLKHHLHAFWFLTYWRLTDRSTESQVCYNPSCPGTAKQCSGKGSVLASARMPALILNSHVSCVNSLNAACFLLSFEAWKLHINGPHSTATRGRPSTYTGPGY